MSMWDFWSELDDLVRVFKIFTCEIAPIGPRLGSPLLSLLVSRMSRAISEGMPILESECSQRMLMMPPIEKGGSNATLLHRLEVDLNREENAMLRWLLIAHWAILCDFGAITSNVERLVESNLSDWIWLVAGAIWVQSASGQPTACELQEALVRVRTRYPEFDAHLAAALAGPPGPIREAADLAERLFADPSMALPTFSLS